jgi:hypothetical protein
MLAARAIVAVENPADVCAISCQPQGRQRLFSIEEVRALFVNMND